MTDLPAPDERPSGTPGSALAAARQAAGLTAADVAAQMRISLRQLEAIESDRYGELPGSVFVRGFVRNYARLLGLDPAPLLHALEPALDGEAPLRAQHYAGALPTHSRRSHTRVWLGVFVLLLIAVLGAAVYEYWRNRSSSAPLPEAVPPRAEGSAAAPAEARSAPGTASEPVPLAPERVPQSPAQQGGSDAGQTAPGATVAPGGAAPRPGRVEFTFTAESWVEVRDKDGNVLLSVTGAPGTARVAEGVPPLTLTVGNASGVRITYNQKPVDVTANASRNIARFTLE